MLPQFDIAIDRLQLRTAKQQARAIAADLQQGGWSVGEINEWLFIKELKVSSPKNGLRLNASRAIRDTALAAVDGRSPQARDANVVRFANLPELLAFLLRDIAHGRRAWFWKKWANFFDQPRSEAITQILWENISELAAIVGNLARSGELPAVWRQLTNSHAKILLAKLASLQNVPLPSLLPSIENVKAFGVDETILNAERIFLNRNALIPAWRQIYTVSSDCDQKFFLAAVASALTTVPHALSQDPSKIIAAFYRSIVNNAAGINNFSELMTENIEEATHLAETNNDSPASENNATNARFIQLTDDDDISEQQIDTSQLGKPQVDSFASRKDQSLSENEPLQIPRSEKNFNDSSNFQLLEDTSLNEKVKLTQLQSDRSHLADKLDEIESNAFLPDQYQFYTRFGGFFYLINAINHPVSYALLRETSEWEKLLSGWTLVYRIATALDGNLDVAMQRFIANVAGLESVAELTQHQHRELVDVLLPEFRNRYQVRLPFDASLLALPARVTVNYSHVYVDYHMSAIRLPVRLCGLDVDPGWIPWLGRVVRFRYLEDSQLKMEVEHE